MSIQRAQLATQKMRPGSLGGQSRIASPVVSGNLFAPTGMGSSPSPVAEEPVPTRSACPQYIGRTTETFSPGLTTPAGGPFLLPDRSEMIQWINTVVYHWAYPVDGSTQIDNYTVDGTAYGMAITPDGALWRTNSSGDIIRRSDHTSASSDVVMATLTGSENRSRLVYSNHDNCLYAVTYVASSVLKFYRITLSGTVTLLLTTSVSTGTTGGGVAVPPGVVAAGAAVWVANPTVVGSTVTNVWLYKYEIDLNIAVGITQPADTVLAVDDEGCCIYTNSYNPTVLYRVGDDDLTVPIGCDDLDGQDRILQGGSAVPGDPTSAVMSHYIEYTGEPDGDWIWEWPLIE